MEWKGIDMRKLATIRRIDDIREIPEASAIEAAVVGGWVVVIKKGEFKVGQLAVYLEIDSWVPHEIAPFLSKGQEPREYNGVKGERLRTAKFRGQISQGLLLPVYNDRTGIYLMIYNDEVGEYSLTVAEGDDVTQELGIQKWEAPIPAQLAGDVEGVFPSFVPKTDEERIQNLTEELKEWSKDLNMKFEITEKLDGSSMTVYHKDGKFGVCSRNWALKETEGNSLWKVARHYYLENILTKEGNYAVQGELIGEGIQGNPYKIKGQDYYVYNVYDINEQRYLCPHERQDFVKRHNLKHVPILFDNVSLFEQTTGTILGMAEGKSVLNNTTEREGIVFKHNGKASFKAISNKFLLKYGG